MKVSYFPGCTLKNKAKDLDVYARKSAEALGVTLEEIENWQCCGGVFSTARDEVATKLSSVRALKEAASKDQPLVTVCSACHNVIKQTNHAMQTDKEFASKVNNYIADGVYEGETEVYHYLEMLRDVVGYDELKKKVVNSFKGKKIAAYYGCLLLRPNSVMKMDDPENPSIMEDFISAIGATPVVYAKRNECCGGYIAMESPELAKKSSNAVIENAKAAGAEMIITACPLCRYNLIKNGADIPVVYFTELLAEALGVKEDTNA
ncbi:MAG: CoB--CoM heterodisulfide reductase iron-sulfur subunit B family protein [Clostridia bacterium]|nr:CoB--CoM heterodisulfide reductase iron-sulfur subunit B family protein [Clostridia bacterium]MBQ8863022.1 CoB--CoM heterodisulfide reductase iron-sulfur subunit B family protein [Clostridia bacterium]